MDDDSREMLTISHADLKLSNDSLECEASKRKLALFVQACTGICDDPIYSDSLIAAGGTRVCTELPKLWRVDRGNRSG